MDREPVEETQYRCDMLMPSSPCNDPGRHILDALHLCNQLRCNPLVQAIAVIKLARYKSMHQLLTGCSGEEFADAHNVVKVMMATATQSRDLLFHVQVLVEQDAYIAYELRRVLPLVYPPS